METANINSSYFLNRYNLCTKVIKLNQNTKWKLSDGTCEIQDGQILYQKEKKIIALNIADIQTMEKEEKHDWVSLCVLQNDRKVKKELNFKENQDAQQFVDTVAERLKSGGFQDKIAPVGVYHAVKRPLAIFLYTALLILLIMAIAYGTDYAMQIFNISQVRVPAVLLLLMNFVYALGITKCLVIIGVIGLLCLLGALVRVVKRPMARIIASRKIGE